MPTKTASNLNATSSPVRNGSSLFNPPIAYNKSGSKLKNGDFSRLAPNQSAILRSKSNNDLSHTLSSTITQNNEYEKKNNNFNNNNNNEHNISIEYQDASRVIDGITKLSRTESEKILNQFDNLNDAGSINSINSFSSNESVKKQSSLELDEIETKKQTKNS